MLARELERRPAGVAVGVSPDDLARGRAVTGNLREGAGLLCGLGPGFALSHRQSLGASAPAWWCQCGVYGLSRLNGDELEEVPRVPGRDPDRGAVALGVVLLWGRVIQHARGYRAEYARPLKLLMVPPPNFTRAG